MNRATGKIPAFTLSEMMVVLAVTTVVVALAFTVLGLVRRQMSSIEDHFSDHTRLELLEQSLWLDFNRYQEIVYDPVREELLCRTETDSVYYRWYQDYLVRERDTFRVKLASGTFYRDGQEILSGPTDAVLLETSADSLKNRKVFVYKNNDAATYMNP